MVDISRPVEAVRPPRGEAPSITAAVLAPVPNRRLLVRDSSGGQISVGRDVPPPVESWRSPRLFDQRSLRLGLLRAVAPPLAAAVLAPVPGCTLLVGDSRGCKVRIAGKVPAPIEAGRIPRLSR